MRNIFLEQLFMTGQPACEVPARIRETATLLTDKYIRNNIILVELADYEVHRAINNRFINLLLAGIIDPNTTCIDLKITNEMEVELYHRFKQGDETAGPYEVAFLSYRVANFMYDKLKPLPKEPLRSDIAMSLYLKLLDIIKNEWNRETRIPRQYLEYCFLSTLRQTMWENSPMFLSKRRYEISRVLWKLFGSEMNDLPVEQLLEGYNSLGLSTKISANDVEFIRAQKDQPRDWRLEEKEQDELANEWMNDGKFFEQHCSDLIKYAIVSRTLELAKKMDTSLDERTILLIVRSLQNFFDEKRGKGFKKSVLRLLAAEIEVVPITYEMVMYCYATSVKEVKDWL